VAHPFVDDAVCVQGLEFPSQLVHATISFGPLCSRRLSPFEERKEFVNISFIKYISLNLCVFE
jgi:hypothetical protein